MRAGIYVRLSSDPRGRGKSVGEQEADSRADCERQGWQVAGVYSDNDRSASRFARRDREAFERLLTDVRAGRLDVIVAWEASRFTRDTEVYGQLAKACREQGVLYSYNGRVLDLNDPDDAFNAGLDALLSEREAGVVRKRVMRTHRFNAEAGLPHGQVAYGYRRIYDDRTGALLQQVPEAAESVIVKEIFHRVGGGESLRSIARSLTTRAVATPSGGDTWTTTSLKRILTRRQYLGKRVWNGKVMQAGGWEPLVDEVLFERCQQILADPRRRSQRQDATSKHLLSGIIECDECGDRMRASPRNGIPSYCCERGHVARAKKLVDEPVERLVRALLQDPRTRTSSVDPAQQALVDEVERIDMDIAALPGLVEREELTALIASAEQRRLEKRKQEIQNDLRRVSPLPAAALEGDWSDWSLETRREVVRVLFSSLRAVKKKGQAQVGRHAPGVLYVLARDPQQEPVLLTA